MTPAAVAVLCCRVSGRFFMSPNELFKAGKLTEALQALTSEVRANPTDIKRRTFLFELLCFSGEFDRADKQLEVLGEGGGGVQIGALLYRAALQAERTRHDLFQKKEFPQSPPEGNGASGAPEALSGSFNGRPFQFLSDADPRIGARLEVFAAGSYLWVPFQHITSIDLPAPRRLRDLLWAPAVLRTGPAFHTRDLGEVLLPVLSPFSWRHPDEAVRLGRMTVWEEAENNEAIPFGQKMLLIDEEEVPLLELRKLEIQSSPAAS